MAVEKNGFPNFPSNSYTDKKKEVTETTPLKVEKVVTGNVRKVKKSFGKRLLSTFMSDDFTAGAVRDYIVHDVVVPAVVNTFLDILNNSAEMFFYGTISGKRSNNKKSGSKVNYTSYSQSPVRSISKTDKAMHNFDDIIFDSKGEAEEVLGQLIDLIELYDRATVADFYALCGITSEFTDQKYGWTNLSESRTKRVSDGYLIVLPRPVVL